MVLRSRHYLIKHMRRLARLKFFRHQWFFACSSIPVSSVIASAQRLSASMVLREAEAALVVQQFRCSTPFGINGSSLGGNRLHESPANVLNAFRHQWFFASDRS